MAASIPRPSRPSYGPPTTALPALPIAKTRKSTGNIPSYSDAKSTSSAPALPRSGLRAPSGISVPTAANLALPRARGTPGVNAAGRTLRKTVSINSFPQPPRGIRTASLPPSPLSGGARLGRASSSHGGDKIEEADTSHTPGSKLQKRKTKTPKNQSYVGSTTPSLLNGSGDSRSISSGPGARGSDGLLSLPSPPQSRSSSAQDSYSTSATTFDDNGEGSRGRESTADLTNGKPVSKPGEGKGNVIVSVRVRPDAGSSGEPKKTEGEWLVDGRRSLIAFRGKEGADYYYGKYLGHWRGRD